MLMLCDSTRFPKSLTPETIILLFIFSDCITIQQNHIFRRFWDSRFDKMIKKDFSSECLVLHEETLQTLKQFSLTFLHLLHNFFNVSDSTTQAGSFKNCVPVYLKQRWLS